ncbi:MAG: toll/interleukin-1 receptor domain-containing protein [Planctomycetes bacterium]|nr:toll/interleukin-1 receptor domain-containing protein [Planctomycetota bacterium]
MSHDVFVSFAAPDRSVADALCHALEGAGIRCWVAPRDVEPGRPYASCIMEAIASCSLISTATGTTRSARELVNLARGERVQVELRSVER